VLQCSGLECGGLSVMWQNADVVRWLYVYMSRFMYKIESGWVGFAGVWGGFILVLRVAMKGGGVLEGDVGGCGWAGV
jgi:hypothetical protein